MQVLQSLPQNSGLIYAFTGYYQIPLHLYDRNHDRTQHKHHFTHSKRTTQWHQVQSPYCANVTTILFTILSPSQIEALSSSSTGCSIVTSPGPSKPPSFSWMHLALLVTLYKWNHAMFVLLWLSYFTCRRHNVLTLQPQYCVCQNLPVFKAEGFLAQM